MYAVAHFADSKSDISRGPRSAMSRHRLAGLGSPSRTSFRLAPFYRWPIAMAHGSVPLPRAPPRGWESRLADRHVVRPNDDLFAVLPLDRYPFVSGLVSALIDRKIAEERSRLEA